MQTGLSLAYTRIQNPANRLHFPIEGTVIHVHFPQDESSLSKNWIEYDVVPTVAGLGVFRNVPLALGVQGLLDAEEVLLKPAALIVASTSEAYTEATYGAAQDTDGDRVLVQFINGSFVSPVITHVLTHGQRTRSDKIQSKYDGKLEVLTPGPAGDAGYTFGAGGAGATAVDLAAAVGTRFRHNKINGTHLALDANGDVFVNFNPHPDDKRELATGAVKKKLVIQNEGTDLLRLERTDAGFEVVLLEGQAGEDLVFQVGEDTTLEVKRTGGDWTMKVGDGAKHVAIVEALQTLWGNLKNTLDIWGGSGGHVHPTGVGPSGPPSPVLVADAWTAGTINSTKVSIPDG